MTQLMNAPRPSTNGGALASRQTVMGALAERYSMDPTKLLDTIKATCIKGHATNEQVQAFLIVANRYGLDPFLKQIHAFAGKGGGIVPIVGIDGWTKIINEQDRFDGMDEPRFVMAPDGKPESCTVTIYVKGRAHPVVITEYFDECYRNTEPWNGMPRRMLRHKTLMQCARVAFGLGGIYDEDEAKDIVDGEVVSVAQPRGTAALMEKLNARKALPDTQLPDEEIIERVQATESPAPVGEASITPAPKADLASQAEGQPGAGGEVDASGADAEPADKWPAVLPDGWRKSMDSLKDLILERKGDLTAPEARKRFAAAHKPDSWAMVPKDVQDQLYAALRDGTFKF